VNREPSALIALPGLLVHFDIHHSPSFFVFNPPFYLFRSKMTRFRFSLWRRRQSTKVLFSLVVLWAILMFLHTDEDATPSPATSLAPHSTLNDTAERVEPLFRPKMPLLAGPKKLAKGLATRWQTSGSAVRSGPTAHGLTEEELTLTGSWADRETKFERGIPGFSEYPISELVRVGTQLGLLGTPDGETGTNSRELTETSLRADHISPHFGS
jgi:hypothetical protein